MKLLLNERFWEDPVDQEKIIFEGHLIDWGFSSRMSEDSLQVMDEKLWEMQNRKLEKTWGT